MQFLTLCTITVLSLHFIHSDSLEATCNSGTYRGTEKTSPSGAKYIAFRGIPFALPPIGQLRFEKPQPHPRIDGVFDASQAAPNCLQPEGVDIAGGQGQEDCLYLNVFTPVLIKDDQSLNLKKVLVYIHGGAFFAGSGNEYVPGDLVAQGDIIVVTLNYRLAWLGFLKANSTQLPGNQGYWDQLMALQWVSDNIRGFGGDPDDITLAGQSMGGESVSVWSILPHGSRLFTKGIVMSGTIFTCPSTPGSSDVLLDLLVDRVGCKSHDLSTERSEEELSKIVSCLRDLPSDKFRIPSEGSLTNKFTSIDKDLFPASVQELVSDNNFLKNTGFFDKTFLVSLTNHEGPAFSNGIFAGERGSLPEKEFLSKKVRVPLSVIEKTYDWYTHSNISSINTVHDIWTDPILAVPTFDFMNIHSSGSKVSKMKSNSFFLLFDMLPDYLPSPHKGTFHTLDLTYIFDFSPNYVLKSFYNIDSDLVFTEEDHRIKSVMINMVADFVKTGDPSKMLSQTADLHWPSYHPDSQFYLRLDSSRPTVAQFPLAERRHFWTDIFPKWMDHFNQAEKLKDEL